MDVKMWIAYTYTYHTIYSPTHAHRSISVPPRTTPYDGGDSILPMLVARLGALPFRTQPPGVTGVHEIDRGRT